MSHFLFSHLFGLDFLEPPLQLSLHENFLLYLVETIGLLEVLEVILAAAHLGVVVHQSKLCGNII